MTSKFEVSDRSLSVYERIMVAADKDCEMVLSRQEVKRLSKTAFIYNTASCHKVILDKNPAPKGSDPTAYVEWIEEEAMQKAIKNSLKRFPSDW